MTTLYNAFNFIEILNHVPHDVLNYILHDVLIDVPNDTLTFVLP